MIILFATTLGFIQEFRAEKAMEALKRMAAPTASVIRDGAKRNSPPRNSCPGTLWF